MDLLSFFEDWSDIATIIVDTLPYFTVLDRLCEIQMNKIEWAPDLDGQKVSKTFQTCSNIDPDFLLFFLFDYHEMYASYIQNVNSTYSSIWGLHYRCLFINNTCQLRRSSFKLELVRFQADNFSDCTYCTIK